MLDSLSSEPACMLRGFVLDTSLHFTTPLGTFDFFNITPFLNNSNQFLFYDPNVNIAAFSLYKSHLTDVVYIFWKEVGSYGHLSESWLDLMEVGWDNHS